MLVNPMIVRGAQLLLQSDHFIIFSVCMLHLTHFIVCHVIPANVIDYGVDSLSSGKVL